MSQQPKIGRFNLPKEYYPITIQAMRSDNRQVVWERVIDLPNEGPIAMAIPPLATEHGVRIIIRITNSQGEVSES